MRKYIFGTALFVIAPFVAILVLATFLVLYQHKSTLARTNTISNTVAYAALPTSQNTLAGIPAQEDGRKEQIRQFLVRYNSPMEDNAADVVDAADKYGLDYRLIPAIAMQESNLCKKIPVDSHNCWGFGIYGKTVTRFDNYKEGIYTVTKALATKYKKNGLVTPDQIMTMYTPSSNGSWAFSVNHFMNQLQ
jgi:hypothetical protein